MFTVSNNPPLQYTNSSQLGSNITLEQVEVNLTAFSLLPYQYEEDDKFADVDFPKGYQSTSAKVTLIFNLINNQPDIDVLDHAYTPIEVANKTQYVLPLNLTDHFKGIVYYISVSP
mmetsp:Transcript_7584/g.6876  ORF Transcript_7584/g.6876 Transcript_7584/m.6876 type:complete len:116 (+) Transcript_7584:297-644(+)